MNNKCDNKVRKKVTKAVIPAAGLGNCQKKCLQ